MLSQMEDTCQKADQAVKALQCMQPINACTRAVSYTHLFKMEQIAAMQQATQEVEEKLAQVTAELNAEREARGKEASQGKEEKEVKSLKETKQTKETGSKNKLQKKLDKKSAVKEEKPKKKSLFSRKKEETSSSDSEDREEEAL